MTVPADAFPDLHRQAADGGARPVLSDALRPVWRGRGSVQFGVDPERAVVVDGVDERTVRTLLGLDGARTKREVLVEAAADGLDPAVLGTLIDELRAEGALVDADAAGFPAGPLAAPAVVPAGVAGWDTTRDRAGASARVGRRTGAGARAWAGAQAGAAARLAPDRAALSLLAGGDQAAVAMLARRRAAAVVVHVADRVGVTLAALLAAAGVGHVQVVDQGRVRPADAAPGGLAAADAHRSRGTAASDAVRRAAPEAATGPLAPDRLPDLVVLASARPVEEGLRAVLQNAGLPHLALGVRETAAVVGPLVLPGQTTCLRCTDLHRTDCDPAWPLLAAQLSDQRSRRVEPCDVVLATMAAAVGALQCLAQLDGGAPASLGGTLELALPDWRLRRRSWAPHRLCGCGAWPAPAARPPGPTPAIARNGPGPDRRSGRMGA